MRKGLTNLPTISSRSSYSSPSYLLNRSGRPKARVCMSLFLSSSICSFIRIAGLDWSLIVRLSLPTPPEEGLKMNEPPRFCSMNFCVSG